MDHLWDEDDELDVEDPVLNRLLDKPELIHTMNSTPDQSKYQPKVDTIDTVTSLSCLRTDQPHMGFDNNTGDTWIYPTNMPCRTYQLNISHAALYRNTLVVLPTGLGKTFIAAVVMYNIYRWYPRGKVLFMAPTRPLVNQQIEACQHLMPFPSQDTVEMTGRLPKAKRVNLWQTKRVFFATPQVVQSDACLAQAINSNNSFDYYPNGGDVSMKELEERFPYEQIKLLVIDEAHKAKGRYAYTEVVQTIARYNRYFRVLALTATPGRTMLDVAEICHNLLIAHIEIRNENSIDVQSYVHKRRMETIVVKLDEKLTKIRDELLQIIEPYLKLLHDAEVISGTGNVSTMNRNFLIFEQKRFREHSFQGDRQQTHPKYSTINSNFSICIALYHSLELLLRHGLYAFLSYFDQDDPENVKTKYIVQMDRRLRLLIERLKTQLDPSPLVIIKRLLQDTINSNVKLEPCAFGHPKFEKTHRCLMDHFTREKESRAIVFCEYRESVLLLYHLLSQEKPLLRPRCFVGQGGGKGALRAVTQKQQLQIMNDFRSGTSNILIATSIGEEGIDVGDVDLIVCFDISSSNPTRFIQRIGRTGRKRNGHVVMLVTEGREQQLLKDVLAHKDQTNNKILKSSAVKQALYKVSPRLVPDEFKPQCVRTLMNAFRELDKEQEEDKGSGVETMTTPEKNRKRSSPRKGNVSKLQEAAKGTQDLRQLFNRQLANKQKEKEKEQQQLNQSLKREKVNDIIKLMDDDDFIVDETKSFNDTKMSVDKTIFIDDTMAELEPVGESVTARNTATPLKGNKVPKKIEVEVMKDDNSSPEEVKKVPLKRGKKSKRGSNFAKKPQSKNLNEIAGEEEDRNSVTKAVKTNLRKLNKFLRTNLTTNELLTKANNNDLKYHLIENASLSREMKLFLLKEFPEFVREQFDLMSILSILDNEMASAEIDAGEQSIRNLHNVILDLFGGKEEIENFLNRNDIDSFKADHHSIMMEDILMSEQSDNEDEFMEKLDEMVFNGLHEQDPCCDNYDFIQEEFKNTNYCKNLKMDSDDVNGGDKMMMIPNQVEDIIPQISDKVDHCFDEYLMDNTFESILNESKYYSQIFQEREESTPIQRVQQLRPKTTLKMMLDRIGNNDITFLSNSDVDGNTTHKDGEERRSSTPMNRKCSPTVELKEEKLSMEEFPVTPSSSSVSRSQTPPKEHLPAVLSSSSISRTLTPPREQLPAILSSANSNFPRTQTPPKENLSAALSSKLSRSQTPPKETPPLTLSSTLTSRSPTPTKQQVIESKPKDLSLHLEHELDIDMNAFLEPFPEETELLQNRSSQQIPETEDKMDLPQEEKDLLTDIFIPETNWSPQDHFSDIPPTIKYEIPTDVIIKVEREDEVELERRKVEQKRDRRRDKEVMEAERVAKAKEREEVKEQLRKEIKRKEEERRQEMQFLSPSKLMSTSSNDPKACQKSPSIFDLYIQNTRGKVHLGANVLLPAPSTVNENQQKHIKMPDNPTSCVQTTSRSPVTSKTNSLRSKLHRNWSKCCQKAGNDNELMMMIKKEESSGAAEEKDDSVICRTNSWNAYKRRKVLLSSDTDSDLENRQDNRRDKRRESGQSGDGRRDESEDDELIEATQQPARVLITQHRKRRRLMNPFIDDEAEASDSGDGEGLEADETIGCYQLDSVIVATDDEEDEVEAVSVSHMEAIYLKSLKSPAARRGTFKIPPPRIFNDRSRIYSPSVGREGMEEDEAEEEMCSQYVADSFVVAESDVEDDVVGMTQCPLERAERILRQRRKMRKLQKLQGKGAGNRNSFKSNRNTRIVVRDSSEEEDDFNGR